LAGCANPRIRREAASTLRCPEGEIELKQLEDGDWFAKGCGRGAFCTFPASAGAEVCRGGVGWLNKEEIRQVITEHIDEIRYCYDRELTNSPNLAGKMTVKFTITASGSVSSSDVAQPSALNSALEECVAARVRTWTFPKPSGGGVVLVTYPFTFKPFGT